MTSCGRNCISTFTEELVELGFFIALTFGQQRWIKTLGIGHGEVLGDTKAGLAATVLSE